MRRRTHIRLRRRLRNSLLLLLTPAALLLGLRLAWGIEAAHRLAAEQATLRAQHLPVDVHDLLQPQIPDADNAAAPLLQAMQSFSLTDLEIARLDSSDHVPPYGDLQIPEEDRTLFLAAIERNANALRTLDAAILRPAIAWPESSLVTYPDFLNYAHALDPLLSVAVVIAPPEQQALHLRRLLSLARLVDTHPSLGAHHRANYIRNSVLILLEANPRLIMHDLPLLASMTDDTVAKNDVIASDAEFASARAEMSPELPLLQSWFFAPLVLNETARIQAHAAAYHAVYATADWPTAASRIPPAGSPYTPYFHLAWIGGFFSTSFRELPSATVQREFTARATAHSLALLLAAADFTSARDHPPQSVNDLVPDFLPALPIDPYSAAHAPLHYRLDPGGPTVWSVGPNGADDGGAVTGRSAFTARNRSPDIVFGAAYIAALAPAPP